MANLLTNPEDFSNAAWTKDDCSITGDSDSAPDNTVTADTWVENTLTRDHRMYQAATVSAGAEVSLAVFIKAKTRRYSTLAVNNGASELYGVVDTNNFTFSESGANGTAVLSDLGIIPIDDNWYRVWIKGSIPTLTSYFAIFGGSLVATPGIPDPVYLGDSSSFGIWGASLEEGALTPYESEAGIVIGGGVKPYITITRRSAKQMNVKQRIGKARKTLRGAFE